MYSVLNNIENDEAKKNKLKILLLILVKIISGFLAIYLILPCNKKSNIFVKFILVLFSFLFSEIYLLYYIFYRGLLGFKCYS